MQKLLLLHGAIGAKDQLQPLAEELKNDYEVHSINFSGHGGEQMPNSFSIELFANDVLTYLDKNNIQKINIFGYSMGGYVALYLAKYYPNKIEKVFTLATKFEWNPDISQKEIKMLDANKIEEKIPAFAKILENRHQPNNWKVLLKKTSDMMIALGNKNCLTLQDLTSITIPTKIGVGDNDNMVTLGETKEVAQNLKNSELVILQDTLHPIEKVDLKNLSEEIKTFFK
ncbi:MAG TPA: alpha/beta fold hydrolase [Bacteroidia bacterium]|nr:alpha/beta fold hydrolase [Bacteroidia bacterium]